MNASATYNYTSDKTDLQVWKDVENVYWMDPSIIALNPDKSPHKSCLKYNPETGKKEWKHDFATDPWSLDELAAIHAEFSPPAYGFVCSTMTGYDFDGRAGCETFNHYFAPLNITPNVTTPNGLQLWGEYDERITSVPEGALPGFPGLGIRTNRQYICFTGWTSNKAVDNGEPRFRSPSSYTVWSLDRLPKEFVDAALDYGAHKAIAIPSKPTQDLAQIPERKLTGGRTEVCRSLQTTLGLVLGNIPAVITQGTADGTRGRNDTLHKLIARPVYWSSWRPDRTPATEEELFNLLSIVNQERCDPPLDDDDVWKLAASAINSPPPRWKTHPYEWIEQHLGGLRLKRHQKTILAEFFRWGLVDENGKVCICRRSRSKLGEALVISGGKKNRYTTRTVDRYIKPLRENERGLIEMIEKGDKHEGNGQGHVYRIDTDQLIEMSTKG